MIFVTVGTQTLGFERLLCEVSRLVNIGIISDFVEIQSGFTKHQSSNAKISYSQFISPDEMALKIQSAKYVITHGGVGSILSALHFGKKIIAVPRLKKFREHINNHQLDIIENFSNNNFLLPVYNINDLASVIEEIDSFIPNKYVETNIKLISEIKNKIDSFI